MNRQGINSRLFIFLRFIIQFTIFSCLNKRILIVLLFSLLGGLFQAYAQTGGRKKEHRNQRRSGSMFSRTKSQGNADAFAKGGITRKKSKRTSENLWVYKKTTLKGKKQKREDRFLFFRYRTKGKRYRDGILAKQNAARAKKRVRGNKVFAQRKY